MKHLHLEIQRKENELVKVSCFSIPTITPGGPAVKEEKLGKLEMNSAAFSDILSLLRAGAVAQGLCVTVREIPCKPKKGAQEAVSQPCEPSTLPSRPADSSEGPFLEKSEPSGPPVFSAEIKDMVAARPWLR